MHLTITARHMDLTDGLRAHVEKELTRLDRHFHKETDVQVTLCVEKYRHIAEVSCNVGGRLFQATEQSKDMYQSVDRAVERMGEQFKKFKSKRWSGKGKAGLDQGAAQIMASASPNPEPALTSNKKPRIIRARRYAVKPMSADEAAMQIELMGQDFIVYTDSQTDQVNVLYRRKDGNLGLIEPIYE